MRLSRLSTFALLAGFTLLAPTVFAEDNTPAPAPPAPAGPPSPGPDAPDDLKRAIHEAELKLEEAKAAGRERQEAEIRETLERLRAARKEAQQARERLVVEEKLRHDKDATDRAAKEREQDAERARAQAEAARALAKAAHAQAERVAEAMREVDVVRGVVEQDGKIRLDGPGGEIVVFESFDDGPSFARVEFAALQQVHERLLADLRGAEKAGNKDDAERLREKARAIEAKMKALQAKASREGPGGGVRYYPELTFDRSAPEAKGVAELDRRIASLRQAQKLLKDAGMADMAQGLQEDIGRLERERAKVAAAGAAPGRAFGGDASALAKEVHALREQVEGLRHELREMRAMLEKALAR